MVNGVEVTKEGICHVTDYIHVVNGKIICFDKSVFDRDNPDDMRELARFGEGLYDTDGICRAYGDETVCIVHNMGEYCLPHPVHVSNLPPAQAAIVRKVIGELHG